MTICSACGTTLESDAAACAECGAPGQAIAGDRHCPTCLAAVGATDLFCASCGTSIESHLGEDRGRTDLVRSTGGREELDGELTGIAQDADAPADGTSSRSTGTLSSGTVPVEEDVIEQVEALTAEEERVVQVSGDGEGDAVGETPRRLEMTIDDALGATPLPPVPDGGLNQTMPTWLRTGPDALRTIGMTTSAPPMATKRDQPEKINPSQLISEDDLPEWIRQLVATETAEKASADARQAAEAEARVASARHTADALAVVSRQRSEPRLTVGEGSANPWLSRRDDRTGATHREEGDETPIGGRTSVFADMVESDGRRTPPSIESDEPVSDGAARAMPPREETIATPTPVQQGDPAANRAKWLFWVAAVLFIVAVAAYAASSGTFG